MYTLPCCECKQDHPRARYRKRGGGVHKICPDCRKKEYNERARLRQRMKVNKETLEQREAEVYKKRRIKALTVEYNRITAQNKARIRIMQANPKPTKATIRNLAWRLAEQERWHTGLQNMKEKLCAGERLGQCLRDYLEGRCIDA